MDSGDYVFPDLSIAIETKWSFKDLADSVKDGRLFRQIDSMIRNFEHSALFIVGDFDKLYLNPYVHFSVEQKRGLKGRLLSKCFPFTIEKNSYDCFEQMDSFVKKCTTEEHVIKPKPFKHKTAEPEERVLIALGVNIKQAKEILDLYTIKDLHNISKEELMEVRGVGARTVDKIKNVFY